MSAALQVATLWAETDAVSAPRVLSCEPLPAIACEPEPEAESSSQAGSLAFYRQHTEKLLRRYLYASMQVGRAPAILGEHVPTGGAASFRQVHTFEDAVIFVLDVEKCLGQIGYIERQILSKVVLQAYTQSEAAMLLGMSMRAMAYSFPRAMDALTEKLLDAGLLTLAE